VGGILTKEKRAAKKVYSASKGEQERKCSMGTGGSAVKVVEIRRGGGKKNWAKGTSSGHEGKG